MNKREYYIDQYKQLHASKSYGTSSGRQLVKPIQHLINIKKPQSVLDYGCGQSDLYKKLNGPKVVDRYDPAIPDLSTHPTEHYDMVLCTDVMEHIPEEEVDNVLNDLHSLGDTVYVVISCIEAYALLPNGENAHTTVKPQQWWVDKLKTIWDSVDTDLARIGYVSAVLN